MGTLVAFLNTSDSDVIEVHTYKLTDHTNFPDNFNFEIVKNELRTKKIFDFEKKNKYYIKIRTTDFRGLFYEAQF